ncbi:fluoride efflux transporter CrcB [Catenibacterium mitsuokai]|uniref:fluoride efflux transporter CrcB n=1 Tax=Catenibacterium mitsuokai TaxID=100886 RepID=UPI001FD31466|nr:fluoride efflux transporter CrcB [Catenibacterium mitsuokai]
MKKTKYMTACLYVGMGGFIGSVLRYLVSLIPLKTTHGFPLLTLFINILGAFLIGFISTIALKKSMNPHLVLLLKTGLCGGFTTFSTFALESITLHKNGNTTLAMIYIVLSIVLGLSAVILGDYFAH